MNELTTLQTAEMMLAQHATMFKQNIKATSSFLSVTKTGKFKLPDLTESESLDVVILDFVYRNQYFAQAYNANNYQPPVCQAIGKSPNEFLSPIAALCTSQQHDSCGPCPKNQWKSSPTGQGKACQNQLILAVMMPDPAQDETVMLVKASPTSLRKVGPYLLKMVDMHHHPMKVISNLTVDTSSGYPKLDIHFVSKNPLWDQHVQYLKDAERSLFAGTPLAEDVDNQISLTERSRDD